MNELLQLLLKNAELPAGSTPTGTGLNSIINTVLQWLAKLPPEQAQPLILGALSFLTQHNAPTTSTSTSKDGPEDIPEPTGGLPTSSDNQTGLHLAIAAEWYGGLDGKDQFTAQELANHLVGAFTPRLGGHIRIDVEPLPEGILPSKVIKPLVYEGIWHDKTHGKDTPFAFGFDTKGNPLPDLVGSNGMPINMGGNRFMQSGGYSTMFRTWLYAGDHEIELWCRTLDSTIVSNHYTLKFRGR